MIQKFVAKLNNKEKKILYATILVVVFAFMDSLFLRPILSKLKGLDEDIESQENSIKRDLRFLSYKDRIIKEKKLLNKYYVKKPQSEEEIIAGFLKRIEMLATDSKINLVKVTPTESEQKKGFIEYFANLECTGKLKDIVTFMHLIDSSKELMKIVKLNMNAKKAASDEITSAMTISKILVERGEDEAGQSPAEAQAEEAANKASDQKQLAEDLAESGAGGGSQPTTDVKPQENSTTAPPPAEPAAESQKP